MNLLPFQSIDKDLDENNKSLSNNKNSVSSKNSSSGDFTIGLYIPLCGSAGIWGPSCIACAELAVQEINAAGGVVGRKVNIQIVDASIETCENIESITNQLIDNKEISAIVGMHISAIRQQLSKMLLGRVPFIYTPLYEGNEKTSGIYTIGETPDSQLQPALKYLSETLNIKKWAFIGNDYVWPRTSHMHARKFLLDSDSCIVFEQYVDFGVNSFDELLDQIVKSEAQGVLISLVGQDLIDFNRSFGKRNLHKTITRLSGALEENGLLAVGASNSKNFYATSSYFSNMLTNSNEIFKQNYHLMHGESAPTLNTLGQSIYEGIHFLAALINQVGVEQACESNYFDPPLAFNSVRNIRYFDNQHIDQEIYLAEVEGYRFKNIHPI